MANAGVLDTQGNVDAQFIAEYNLHIKQGYGKKWNLKLNDGVDGLHLDKQHFIYALTMIQLASTTIQK